MGWLSKVFELNPARINWPLAVMFLDVALVPLVVFWAILLPQRDGTRSPYSASYLVCSETRAPSPVRVRASSRPAPRTGRPLSA
jgi:hypothetical protein